MTIRPNEKRLTVRTVGADRKLFREEAAAHPKVKYADALFYLLCRFWFSLTWRVRCRIIEAELRKLKRKNDNAK
jgi:hypothetical protein